MFHLVNLASTQEDLSIIFTNYDCKGVSYPYLDALVVKLIIANCRVWWILIDEGSSADIIFLKALKKMDIKDSKMEVFQTLLVGFNGKQTTNSSEFSYR